MFRGKTASIQLKRKKLERKSFWGMSSPYIRGENILLSGRVLDAAKDVCAPYLLPPFLQYPAYAIGNRRCGWLRFLVILL